MANFIKLKDSWVNLDAITNAYEDDDLGENEATKGIVIEIGENGRIDVTNPNDVWRLKMVLNDRSL